MKSYIYDLETYPNIFTMAVGNGETVLVLEISERKNDLRKIKAFLNRCREKGDRMVGFNNLSFDWPVLDVVYNMSPDTEWEDAVAAIKTKAETIVNTDWHRRFDHVIWNPVVTQIDLCRIHHMDNVARLTSLKTLEFNMQMDSIQELPFDPTEDVPVEDMDTLVEYNKHDVEATYLFYQETVDMIKLREELGVIYDRNMLNYSDAKIGSAILETKLGNEKCYDYTVDGQREPRQTHRPFIRLGECVFDYVAFRYEPFNEILDYFKKTTIKETKGVFVDLKTEFDGVTYHFGTGGLHACSEPKVWEADETHRIIDVDVTSYYPSLAIENQIYPQHLGIGFCTIYNSIKQERLKYPKGSPRNLALKLALNAAYGNSNNKFSFLYDSRFTMMVTINGQLLLCMLVEKMVDIGLQVIQANTDGITVWCERGEMETKLDQISREWEELTNLTLESCDYTKMVVRDVNNYIAISD